MESIVIFFIGLSLSMDAFSLSLAYGSKNLDRKTVNTLSLIVGVYHFIMPLIGIYFGALIQNLIGIHSSYIVPIIFMFIGVNMIFEKETENKSKQLSFFELLLFGFAVSVDSFSVGIGLNKITDKTLLSATTFSVLSTLFTYLGLRIGISINNKLGNLAQILGGCILIIIGLLYLFK